MEINHAIDMKVTEYNYQPIKYFSLVISISWFFMFLGALFSHHDTLQGLQLPFLFLSMISPLMITLWMIFKSKNPHFKIDFINRIFNVSSIPGQFWLAVFLIMPVIVASATVISLGFGLPLSQFELSGAFKESNLLFTVIALILAPSI